MCSESPCQCTCSEAPLWAAHRGTGWAGVLEGPSRGLFQFDVNLGGVSSGAAWIPRASNNVFTVLYLAFLMPLSNTLIIGSLVSSKIEDLNFLPLDDWNVCKGSE